jgi:enterochelin esterase-like enzyme
MRRPVFLAVALALLTLAATAQEPVRPTFTSPEVAGDGRVTVRLWAPKAAEVLLSGDWMGPQPPIPLTKDATGLWTVTVGPLEPNLYSYAFSVDGVRADDPSCRCGFTAAERFASSRLVVPGAQPQAWSERDVPRGTLRHEVWSRGGGVRRRVVVYTPPGYDRSNTQYPVLLLMSGSPGTETDWTGGGGFAEQVFDNLIEDGAMVPMVIVMHASDVLRNGRRADNLKEIEPLITTLLVPEIRSRYRVRRDPRFWAVGGVSLGGEYALTVGLRHRDLFRSAFSISGSLVPPDFDNRFGAAIAAAGEVRRDYRLLWIGTGTGDTFYGGAKALASQLSDAGIPYQFLEIPGPHVMPVFRKQLVAVLPRLFR